MKRTEKNREMRKKEFASMFPSFGTKYKEVYWIIDWVKKRLTVVYPEYHKEEVSICVRGWWVYHSIQEWEDIEPLEKTTIFDVMRAVQQYTDKVSEERRVRRNTLQRERRRKTNPTDTARS